MPLTFASPDCYLPKAPYQLLPFRFTRIPGVSDQILVVNEVGEFLFLSSQDFDDFVHHRLHPASGAYCDLHARQFLYHQSDDSSLELLAIKYRTRKSCLSHPWSLQIFVVTLRCDHSCKYCQVSRQTPDRTRYDMSPETARRAIDLLFQSPAKHITVEFQGGEPLLNFPMIRFIIGQIEERNRADRRTIDYVIATTLHLLDEEILDYLRAHRIRLSTSLDGPEWLHNANRPNRDRTSFERTVQGIQLARRHLGDNAVSALTTITRQALPHAEAIIDTYVELGFRSIFLRPLSPYGFALRTKNAIGYSADEFLNFYRHALGYIIELSRRGTVLDEVYTTLLLTHILTPFPTGYVDLRSPSGAGLGCILYNYDGGVYASDEARMLAETGDFTFRLGSVTDAYEDLLGSTTMDILSEAGCAESLPGCSDCAFLPYCGADPIGHYATQGDPVGHRPTSAFCRKQTGMFQELFRRLFGASPEVMRIFLSWIRGVSVEETLAANQRTAAYLTSPKES